MKVKNYLFNSLIALSIIGCGSSPTNEKSLEEPLSYDDFLTPDYYSSDNESPLKKVIDNFIDYARKIDFHNPIKNTQGQIPIYTVPDNGKFAVGKKLHGNINSHHPAVDLHFENDATQVKLYAMFDGNITTIKGANKWRDYLLLSKNITNDNNEIIGKIVAMYAHLDLEYDEQDGLYLDNTTVQKGTLVSQNLYANTVGGAHLHFEIRYYKVDDNGDEEFYGRCIGDFTKASVSPWQYGCWNQNIAYGYANPRNYNLFYY